jgi:hypothetical protein
VPHRPDDHTSEPAPSPPSRPAAPPTPLRVAVALVGLQGLTLVVLAVLELVHLTGGRLTMGVTTAVFFLGYGAALLLCGYGLLRLVSWARSPVVLAQLIQLGLAWSWRGTPAVAVALAVVAVATLAGLFAPASLAALEPAEDERG